MAPARSLSRTSSSVPNWKVASGSTNRLMNQAVAARLMRIFLFVVQSKRDLSFYSPSEIQILEPLEIVLQRRELRLVDLGLDGLHQGRRAAAPHLGEDRRDLARLARLERGERAAQRHHRAPERVVVQALDERAHRGPEALPREQRIAIARRQALEEARALARIGAGRDALGDAPVEHLVGDE